MNTIENIVNIALSYVGKLETKNNSGFQDPEFQAAMESVGWKKGEAWCASFTRLVYLKAYKDFPVTVRQLERLCSKSAVQTHHLFDKSDWKTVDGSDNKFIKKPQLGALVVWRMGSGYSGHIGVVVDVVSDTEFYTVEGNTNSVGGREGVEVARKKRRTDVPFGKNRLNLIGFILPKNMDIPEKTAENIENTTPTTPPSV